MGTIIGYVIVGLIGGAIAKKLLPSDRHDGLLSTMLLGIFGALLGGFLGGLILNISYGQIFSLRGLFFSVVGAVAILAVQRAVGKGK